MSPEENKKVCLKGHITVPYDRLEQVRAVLPQHIALTRSEPGCLSFEVVEDAEISGRFNVSEVFENQAAFDAHQTRTQASAWFKITDGIPREYTITRE